MTCSSGSVCSGMCIEGSCCLLTDEKCRCAGQLKIVVVVAIVIVVDS